MKAIFILMLSLISLGVFSQTTIKTKVLDADTKEPLPYCNVWVKGTTRGTITNGNGEVSISVDLNNDILVFSFLGYKIASVPAITLLEQKIVLLQKTQFVIQGVTINSGTDYLYDIVKKCRKSVTYINSNRAIRVLLQWAFKGSRY